VGCTMIRRSEKQKRARTATISTGRSYEQVGDTHDLADFAEGIREVTFDVDIKRRRYFVAVDPGILREVRKRAATRGITSESLVNLWLKEKLAG
jgi:hypothetical protein